MLKKSRNKKIKELEKEKLELEIKNLKRFWRSPSFYPALFTLLIAIIAAAISYYSGLFEVSRARINLETSILQSKRDTLNLQIDSLNIEKGNIIRERDSILELVYELYSEKESLLQSQDSVIKAYRIHKKREKTKIELKREILAFIPKIRNLNASYDNINVTMPFFRTSTDEERELFIKKRDSIQRIERRLENAIVTEYRLKYSAQVRIYYNLLKKYFPKNELDSEKFLNEHIPTDYWEFKAAADVLDYYAKKL